MRILVDTNIIIDALTGREPWNKEAEQIFLMAANQIADMYITASSATDIFYILRKHLHNTEESKQVMGKLYDLFGSIMEIKGSFDIEFKQICLSVLRTVDFQLSFYHTQC